MVEIKRENDTFIFEIKGWHKIWALKSRIRLKAENIIAVYPYHDSYGWFKGWRMPGTSIPGIITAGTYITKNERNFWDVMNAEKSIVVELKNERYRKLFIQVEDIDKAKAILKDGMSVML